MKLLVYIHSLENGGAERVVANLANHWASIGWDVTVVTVAPLTTDFYQLDAAVGRICMHLTGSTRNVVAGFVRTAKRVRALRRILQAVRPDIALSAMHTANVILALAARKLPGVLTLGSEHNYPPKAPMGVIWETLRRHAYGRLQAVVPLTHECASWLRDNTHARCIRVIPNAVCWPLSQQKPYLSPVSCCRPGRRILLGVGRLSMEKDFTTLVSVFSRLADRHPEWDLVILGDGPSRGALSAQVHASGLEQRVALPGRVGNVGDWYAHADLYAMTSQYEGFPNTLVEAMASGLPGVSFDCDTGPRDIIRHNVDGFLVAPGDMSCFEEALDRLMRCEQLRQAFATRAVEARERFSMERIARMWEDLFGQLSVRTSISPASQTASAEPLQNALNRDPNT